MTHYGRFEGEVSAADSGLMVNGELIKVYAERDPAQIPWGEAGVEIVIATPGRLLDHMRQNQARFDGLHTLVLDEADRRLQEQQARIQPYLDLLGGVKFFTTRSSLHSDVVIFPESFQGSSTVFDRALSYGLGAGLNLPLYRGEFGVDRRPGTASLSLSVRYLLGTEADIARESVFDEDEGVFLFEVVRSPTDILVPQFGVRVDL
jgi:hypothetical protein